MNEKVFKMIRSGLLLFLFFNSYLFQYIPFILFHANVSDYVGNYNLAVLLSTFADLIIILFILTVYWKDIKEEFTTFIKNIRTNMDTGFGCWLVGLLIMFTANAILVYVFHAEGANNEIAVRKMIHSLPIIMGLNVCFIAPFIEEFVFRKTLKDVFSKPILFVLVSFLLFGIAHVYGMAKTWVDWLYIVPYGALGGAFALAYSKTNTVFTSMAFHMMHNIFVFILILLVL